MTALSTIYGQQFNPGLDIDGLVQDCSNSIANALELLQSCTKPSIYPITSRSMASEAVDSDIPFF